MVAEVAEIPDNSATADGRLRSRPQRLQVVSGPGVNVRTLAEPIGCAEGPVQLPDGDFAVVSLDRGAVYRVSPAGGITPLAVTGGGPNGLAIAADGTLYVAQSGGRRGAGPAPRRVTTGGVLAIRPDGGQDWITQDPISPNDLCFGPDGHLYVTDPTDELHDGRLWRVDVVRRQAELLVAVDWYTNGIGFDPGDEWLYVSSTWDGKIFRFPYRDGALGPPQVALELGEGHPDGFAFDVEGNLTLGVLRRPDATEIQAWSASGELVFRCTPGDVANFTNLLLTADRRLVVTLFRGERGVLVVDDWPRPGLPLHPFR
jgi:gluconolactonase